MTKWRNFCGQLYSNSQGKEGIGSLFDSWVNAMEWQPFWWWRMEVSYCTSGFGTMIQRDLRNNRCSVGLATKKSRSTITCLHAHAWGQAARWPSQQIPLNFHGNRWNKQMTNLWFNMIRFIWSDYNQMTIKNFLFQISCTSWPHFPIDNLHISHNASGMGANIRVLVM